MQTLSIFLTHLIHLNLYLGPFLNTYGIYAYGILFLIIFLETGLVITPFLPGDSLLFTLGALLASAHHTPTEIIILLIFAAFLGDNLNYLLGYFLGPKIFHNQTKFLNQKYLNQAHLFYQNYGSRTLIFARFIPIIRTFAPFVAGIGRMFYLKFILISFLAAVLWINLIICLGYLFGNILWVQHYFSVFILLIILISMLPLLISYFISLIRSKK